jgi:hypothetical protein
VTGIHPTSSRLSARGNTLHIGQVVDDGWDVARYEIPTLRRTGGVRLPSRDGGAPPGDRGNGPGLALQVEPTPAGERFIAIVDGLLAVWDPASGRLAGLATRLGSTDLQVGFHRTLPHLQLRPGHPGQAIDVSGSDWILDPEAATPAKRDLHRRRRRGLPDRHRVPAPVPTDRRSFPQDAQLCER